MKTRFALVLTLVFAANVAHSQSPLTSSRVEHFLNTLDKLSALPDADHEAVPHKGDKLWTPGLDLDSHALQEKMTAPFSSSLTEMRQHEQFDKGLRIMKSEGFGDEVEWAGVGDRVMLAYAALKMGDVEPVMDENMTKALEQLETSQLPEEMKQKMRAAMKASGGLAKTVQEVPAGDIDAVKPHAHRFEMMAEESTRKYQQ